MGRPRKHQHDRPASIADAAARVLSPLVNDARKHLHKLAASAGNATEKRIHTLRSSLRKLEIMIGVLGCGFDARAVDRLTTAVRRTRKSGGVVRDMDVAVLSVRTLCSHDGVSQLAGEEVAALLVSRRAGALKRLATLAASPSHDLRPLLDAVLANPAGRRASLPARCATTLALARECADMTDALAARLATPEHLHSVRLNLKEARTILEALPKVYSTAGAPLAERAKSLSDALGDVNDLAALVALLESLHSRVSARRLDSVGVVLNLARAAHRKAHAQGVRRARREVPALVRDIRAVIFNTTPPFPAPLSP